MVGTYYLPLVHFFSHDIFFRFLWLIKYCPDAFLDETLFSISNISFWFTYMFWILILDWTSNSITGTSSSKMFVRHVALLVILNNIIKIYVVYDSRYTLFESMLDFINSFILSNDCSEFGALYNKMLCKLVSNRAVCWQIWNIRQTQCYTSRRHNMFLVSFCKQWNSNTPPFRSTRVDPWYMLGFF